MDPMIQALGCTQEQVKEALGCTQEQMKEMSIAVCIMSYFSN